MLFSANASGWHTIGAGNATCENWKNRSSVAEAEVLSWMAGFASAANIERASEGSSEYRLELLTYDYLRLEINTVCSNKVNKDEPMYSILFDVLARFPTAINQHP